MNIPWTAYDEEFYAGLKEFFKKRKKKKNFFVGDMVTV